MGGATWIENQDLFWIERELPRLLKSASLKDGSLLSLTRIKWMEESHTVALHVRINKRSSKKIAVNH